MDEYIKREYALDAVLDAYYDTPDIYLSDEKFEAAIRKIQAADVAPVRHGRWNVEWDAERDPKRYFVRIVCSNCGLKTGQKSNYCPNCGAKMNGGEPDA